MIGGANTCLDYEVLEAIGKFTESRTYAEDVSRGKDILSHGYKIYWLSDYRSRTYTDYPTTLKEYYHLRIRSTENKLIYSIKKRNFLDIFKFLVTYLFSLYVLIFPLFFFFNLSLFNIGLVFYIWIYLKKIRIYFIADKNYLPNFRKVLFLKILYYILLEFISNFIVPFDYISYRKK